LSHAALGVMPPGKFQDAKTGGQAQFEPEGPRRISASARETKRTALPGSVAQVALGSPISGSRLFPGSGGRS
jgi:hypothetical protein